MKKMMVICNTFPPAPGIGGRRWAKFCKYLAQQGYELHVAFPENQSAELSTWTNDISDNPSIHKYPLHFKYRTLFSNAGSTFSRLRRKAVSLKLRNTKYSDRFLNSLPNLEVWRNIEYIIEKNNIRIVFVSGDPFLYYYACQLKKNTQCKVILDYRDLWNDHSYYRNFYKLNDAQWKFFEHAENTALQECDAIITVDQHLKDTLNQRVSGSAEKTTVIHNGYDPNDFKGIFENQASGEKIILYFAGNIASDLNAITLAFAKQFAQLKQHKPGLYAKTEIHLKGKMDAALYRQLKELRLENLILDNNFLSLTEYNRELANSSMGIVILGKEYAHSYTTKFSDYLYMQKPVLILGNAGEFSEFVKAHNLGLLFDFEKDDWKFFEKTEHYAGKSTSYDKVIREKFNIKNLAQEVAVLYEKYSA